MESDSHNEGTKTNPITFTMSKAPKKFKEALPRVKENNHIEGGANRVVKPLAVPRYEGGNLVIELDEDDYLKGVDELKFSVVGKLYFPKSCEHLTTMEIKNKLGLIWD